MFWKVKLANRGTGHQLFFLFIIYGAHGTRIYLRGVLISDVECTNYKSNDFIIYSHGNIITIIYYLLDYLFYGKHHRNGNRLSACTN